MHAAYFILRSAMNSKNKNINNYNSGNNNNDINNYNTNRHKNSYRA